MTSTDKYAVEGSFNLTTLRHNTMHNLFYSDIYEFAGSLQGILDEGTYKTTIQNMRKIGWKAQLFKYADVSMLGHGFGVSQYPQFYDRNKKKYQMLPRLYVGSYSGEKGHYFSISMDSCIRKIIWNIYYGFNKWHANYKMFSQFGKFYG